MYTVYRLDFLRVPSAITSNFQSEWERVVAMENAPIKIMQLEEAREVE